MSVPVVPSQQLFLYYRLFFGNHHFSYCSVFVRSFFDSRSLCGSNSLAIYKVNPHANSTAWQPKILKLFEFVRTHNGNNNNNNINTGIPVIMSIPVKSNINSSRSRPLVRQSNRGWSYSSIMYIIPN